MKFVRLSHMLFFITMCVCPIAFAIDKMLTFFENSHDNINFTANKIKERFIPDGYEVIFIGKVRGDQGPLSMMCDRLILYFKGNGTKRNSGSHKTSFHSGDLSNRKNCHSNW